jgi:predicted dehydrogenase
MSAAPTVGIGIIGCGNISTQYLNGAKRFGNLDIRGVADMRADVAAAKAAEFGVKAMTVEEMLADPAIDIVVNLTIPRAHVEVGLRVLDAGKHVYAEKPLGVTFSEGRKLVDAAKAKGLRVGCAPDTFLGGGHQTCRKIVDSGFLGMPIGGTATLMVPGHERWHPDPAFYYDIGGGPVLDMAPYYLTDLVQLYGAIEEVIGMSSRLRNERTILSEPKKGEVIPVKVETHVNGLLRFANGAVVQTAFSFDVAGHKHGPLELYGTEGSISAPDPNRFGGEVFQLKKGGEWEEVAVTAPYAGENHRSIGLADMAYGIRNDRPHRASGDLALHVLEVMEAFETSNSNRAPVAISSRVERPEPLETSLVDGQLAK